MPPVRVALSSAGIFHPTGESNNHWRHSDGDFVQHGLYSTAIGFFMPDDTSTTPLLLAS
jgi:hypothetical protein